MRKFTPVALCLVLAGCASAFNSGGSSDYGCPGMPQGVVCKTPAAVYKMSNGDLDVSEFDTPVGQKGGSAKSNGGASSNGVVGSMPPLAGGPPPLMPLREPPKMMRIWFAPWIDKQDAWHSPSYQVVEVQGRRWATGKMEVQSSPIVTPYVARSSGPATVTPPEPKKPAVATQPIQVKAPTSANGPMDLNAGLPVPPR